MSKRKKPIVLVLSLDDDIHDALLTLRSSFAIRGTRGPGTVEDVIEHMTMCAVDGVNRPGSWERQWLLQAFGEWPESKGWRHPTAAETLDALCAIDEIEERRLLCFKSWKWFQLAAERAELFRFKAWDWFTRDPLPF